MVGDEYHRATHGGCLGTELSTLLLEEMPACRAKIERGVLCGKQSAEEREKSKESRPDLARTTHSKQQVKLAITILTSFVRRGQLEDPHEWKKINKRTKEGRNAETFPERHYFASWG